MTLKPLVAKIFPSFFALRSLDASSEEGTGPSADSNNAPLTIGSRPLRPVYTGRQGAELATGVDAIVGLGPVAGDRDAYGRRTDPRAAYSSTGGAVLEGMHHRQRSVGEGIRSEASPVGNRRGTDTNEDVGEGYSGPSPWVRGDGASERTENSARQVTARSIS